MSEYVSSAIGEQIFTPDIGTSTAEELFKTLESAREPFLRRAREACKFTLPTLLPDRGVTGFTSLPSPESSFGAKAVNTLAAKLTSVLLPPDSPFFKIELSYPDDFGGNPEDDKFKAEADAELVNTSTQVMNSIDNRMIRADTIEGNKHLIACGNVLIKTTEGVNERFILYPLSSYVCQRDNKGLITAICMCEGTVGHALSEEIRNACGITNENINDRVDIYTSVTLVPRMFEEDPFSYEEFKEIKGVEVPGSRKTYSTPDDLPYMVLRYETVPGESYGRGLVEQYQGDILYLNEVTGALKDASVTGSEFRWLVNPDGNTDVAELQETPNGGFCSGRTEDVVALQLGKTADFQVAAQYAQTIESRVSEAFLLNSSIRRDAERVTAYEISVMKRELDVNLGGVYSTLSQEYQVPLLNNLLKTLAKANKVNLTLSVGDYDDLMVKIIGGVVGLGQGTDLQRYDTALKMLATYSPENFAMALRFPTLAKMIFGSLGLQSDVVIKSEQELEEEKQAMQMQQLIQQLGSDPALLQQLNQMVSGGAQNGGAQGQQQGQ